jgi:hypothetical protein
MWHNQSLVGLVVIDVELYRKDYSSISRKYDWRRFELLDVRTDSRTRLNWWWKQKIKKLMWEQVQNGDLGLKVNDVRTYVCKLKDISINF